MKNRIKSESKKRVAKAKGDSLRETIGIDLGDKTSRYAVLDEAGNLIEESTFRNTPVSIERHFAGRPTARIALEVGMQSAWIERELKRFGHEVIVANARELAWITAADTKNDRNDAIRLARLARADLRLLKQVHHRTAEQQTELSVIRARDALVRARTLLINSVRSVAKGFGYRLPISITPTFGARAVACVPETLRVVISELLAEIDAITIRIEAYDGRIDEIASRHQEVAKLTKVPGVGQLTAATFVLTLGRAERFAHSRDVGCYLGLCPKQKQSGASDPQLHITKAGNRYLRKLLVQCAHQTMGKWGKDSALRQWGMAKASSGGKNAKKRAIVATARKLAVLLHRLWRTGEAFQPFPKMA